MCSFLIGLWSAEKSCTTPFKEISPCSSFLKCFDTLPKQKLYQLMLIFALHLQNSYFNDFIYIKITLTLL